MPTEIVRGRDLILFRKGDNLPVTIDEAMAQGGWAGGQGVKWADSTKDEFLVTYADGVCSGFLVWGSDEPADKFTSITGHQPHYRFGVMLSGGCFFSTSSFETYTWTSRQGGPLVPITYNASDFLYISLRGLWTKEDEWDLSGDPRGPLADAPFLGGLVGMVIQPPKAVNNNFMTIQTL